MNSGGAKTVGTVPVSSPHSLESSCLMEPSYACGNQEMTLHTTLATTLQAFSRFHEVPHWRPFSPPIQQPPSAPAPRVVVTAPWSPPIGDRLRSSLAFHDPGTLEEHWSGILHSALNGGLSDAFSRRDCSCGFEGLTQRSRVFWSIISGIMGHEWLNYCLRWGLPGFPTTKWIFFPFPTPFIKNESLSPAHSRGREIKLQLQEGRLSKTVWTVKPVWSLINTLELLCVNWNWFDKQISSYGSWQLTEAEA